MTFRELLRATAPRFRGPLAWAAVVAIAALISYQHVLWNRPELRGRGAAWVSALGVPLVFAAAFVWISPWPWSWSGRKGGRPGRARAAVQAVLASQGGVMAMVLADYLLLRMAGYADDLGVSLRANAVIVAPALMMVGAIQSLRLQAEGDRVRTEALARATQARLLQSQLHPHALFNTINGLAELVREDPLRAEAALETLGELLRDLMRCSTAARLPLAEERRLVGQLLELESLRLGDRLRVSWDWDPALDRQELPPLLLQPLVENAIKHGIAPKREGGELEIHGALAEGVLRLTVRNTGRPLAEDRGEGLGLGNLRQRLDLLYGGRAHLRLESQAGWTEAGLTLPLLPGETA